MEAAAEAQLAALSPALCGRGAIINIGRMTLSLPARPSSAAPAALSGKVQVSGRGGGTALLDDDSLW